MYHIRKLICVHTNFKLYQLIPYTENIIWFFIYEFLSPWYNWGVYCIHTATPVHIVKCRLVSDIFLYFQFVAVTIEYCSKRRIFILNTASINCICISHKMIYLLFCICECDSINFECYFNDKPYTYND